jgi:glucosamine--fructose-6-phosphate aminotransferase (isomerizing)
MRLKEISKVHAEGYCSGEFKHGPLAMINDNTPFILIISND